jgi:hypothetical protein
MFNDSKKNSSMCNNSKIWKALDLDCACICACVIAVSSDMLRALSVSLKILGRWNRAICRSRLTGMKEYAFASKK